jgi:hypothetical protein
MSALCPASSTILALNDGDLANLGHNGRKILLKRAVDIQLECKVTFNSQVNPNGQLDIGSWERGTTALCGSCPFCNLLLEGLQRSLDSKSWDWKLGFKSLNPKEVTFFKVDLGLDRLEYRMDPTPWATGQKSLSTWDVYLVLLSGHALLPFEIKDGRGGSSARLNIEVGFELFAEENDPVAKWLNIHRRPLEASTLSEANVTKIRTWMKDCDENHERCWADINKSSMTETSKEAYFLPTRLLDVGDSTTGQHPRLIIASELCVNGSESLRKVNYMALSYCWGSPEDSSCLLKTTHPTIGARLRSIEIDTMPQAFRDAITVACALGIQYIWIDSLCIIQDDPLDWQAESSRMAEIFSNAYLTVIAATGASCHDSFLHRNLSHAHCTIPLRSEKFESVEGQLSLRFRRRLGTDKMSEIIASRWITRGWTFQEERLASRVLMFGENKFFFDCRTVERSEDTKMCTLRPDWVDTVCEVPQEEEEGTAMAAKREDDDSRQRTSFDHWQILCSHYSYRELTFPEDKLPAISGMASKTRKKVQSDYLGGLWRDHLMHDLFWHTVGIARRPEKYRAPSWSWASLDGKISWPTWGSCVKDKCQMYCTILEAQTVTVGLDPFGAVKDGSLKIFGAILEVERSWAGGNRKSYHPLRLCFEGEEVANANLDIEKAQPWLDLGERKYWALLVAKCEGNEVEKPLPRGLLLKKVGRERDGLDEFQRVGIFKAFSDLSANKGDAVSVWEKSEKKTIIIV